MFRGGGHGIDIRKEGDQEYLYHCDIAHRKVVKTTLDGKVIWEKGTPPEPKVYTDSALFVPTNVAFSPNGDFYADRENHRLQYLTLDGKPIKIVVEGMRQPCHFSLRDDLMVIPDLQSVVTLMDKDNRVVAMLGDGAPSNLRGARREQFIPGKFIHPHGIHFLKNGNILVAEWVPIGRLTLLRRIKA